MLSSSPSFGLSSRRQAAASSVRDRSSCITLIWSSQPVKVANSSNGVCKLHSVLTVKMMALELLTPVRCSLLQPETSVLFKVFYFNSAFKHKLNIAEALLSPLASHTLSGRTYSPPHWYTCLLFPPPNPTGTKQLTLACQQHMPTRLRTK